MTSSVKYSVVEDRGDVTISSLNERRLSESDSISSVDFETAITKAGFGKFNYLMLLIAIPASCTNGYVTSTMSFVIPVAGPDLDLTPTGKALMQSAPYAGLIASGLFWGVLSDSFGRRRLIIAGFLLDFIMNTLSAVIPYLPAILFFKFLSGIMVSGPYSIFMAYLSEVFVGKKKTVAVLSTGTFGCVMTILHVYLAFLVIPAKLPDWVPLKTWQLFIFFSGMPALITGTVFAFCFESPKFLADKGKSEQALAICKKIYSINTGLSPDTYPVQKIRKPKNYSDSENIPMLKKVFAATSALRPPYIKRLGLVIGAQTALALTINLLRLWLPEMLTLMSSADERGSNKTETLCPLLIAGRNAQAATSHVVSSDEVYHNMIILNTGCLFAQLSFLLVSKCIGKKIIIMGVSVVAMFCAILIPNIKSNYVFIPSSIIVAVMTISFYGLIGLIVEIFPTSVRATSVSVTMVVGRLGVFIANFLIASVMYSYCEYMFYTIATFCVCIVVCCIFLDTTPFDTSGEEKKNALCEEKL